MPGFTLVPLYLHVVRHRRRSIGERAFSRAGPSTHARAFGLLLPIIGWFPETF